jgi:hypothetical protein
MQLCSRTSFCAALKDARYTYVPYLPPLPARSLDAGSGLSTSMDTSMSMKREHVGWGLREGSRGLVRACAWAAGEAAGGVGCGVRLKRSAIQ